MKDTIKTIHFIGIGGTGMCGLAQVYCQLGYKVTGSDLSTNYMTQRLQDMGAKIYPTHAASNVTEASLVIRSSAIPEDNPELVEATKLNIPVWHRSKLLLDLMSSRQVIAVAGTHGKTTTSSMIFSMLQAAGIKPTAIIGGRVKEIDSNATLGEGPWLVAEADESDGSFLSYTPQIAVINNIEADHLENYDDKVENVIAAFHSFTKKIAPNGCAVVGIDNLNAAQLAAACKKPVITFGMTEAARIHAVNPQYANFESHFDVYDGDLLLGAVHMRCPGEHNVRNALASIAVGLAVGLSFEDMVPGLESFSGVGRRFELVGESNGIRIFDDYAHNPAKVAAAISGAVTGDAKRVIAVFQPHRYSRTELLAKEFATSFNQADLSILTGVYAAGEKPRQGVSSLNIFDAVIAQGYKNLLYIPDRDEINDYLMNILRPGDLVVFIGAGDIWKVAHDLLVKIRTIPDAEPNVPGGLAISGTVVSQVPMKKHTLIKVGGNAEWLAIAETVDDLLKVVRWAKSYNQPIFTLGAGSNLLVLDSGILGIVIKLGKRFSYKTLLKGHQIRIGASAWLPQIARFASELGLSGLEPVAGIPASLGGALFMNAGAHGRSMFDLVRKIRVVTFDGDLKEYDKSEIQAGYHSTNLKDAIIYEADLQLTPCSSDIIRNELKNFLDKRNQTQPLDLPSAGCFFRNPEQEAAGRLIDMAGLKGSRVGGAMISPKHANFFVNVGDATASDFLELIELARRRVKEKSGIELELEVKIVGK